MKQRLPQPKGLKVEKSKVRDYLLNSKHEDGASKSDFFSGRGFTPHKWQLLAHALKKHGLERPVTGTEKTKWGVKYRVECQLETPDGSNPCVLTVWIKEGKNPPVLVTAYPNQRRG